MRARTALFALLAALSLSAQQAAVQEGKVAELAREGHSRPDTKTWEQHAELLGRPAPKLKLDTWMNGKVRPEDMKGKIVVIDFWATWRRPCIDAIPRNNATAKGYADKGVLWIGICGSSRGEELMGKTVRQMSVTYPVCHPGFGVTDAWRVEYWPTYGVIDRNGILRALGVERDYVEPIIDALLEEETAAERANKADEAHKEVITDSPDKNERILRLAREGHPRPGTETWERHAELLGRPAPRLNLNTWRNGRVTADDMKGRIVVVHFWNAKFQSSLDAMPHNMKMVKKYADKDVILIGVYGGGDTFDEVVGRMGVTYPVCYSGFGTAGAWRVDYWPTYGVIDRNGILRALGVERDYVEPIVDALLEEDAASGNAWAGGDGAQARAAGAYGSQTQRPPAASGSSDNFRFGLRFPITIAQNQDVLNDFGLPIGFCAFTELMFAKAMGVGFSLEYLWWYIGREMANGARTGGSQWKLGADLILRPEGIEGGLFVFAGVGTISANLTASWSVSESGTFTSLGVGYDWRSPSRSGFELRYVAPSFAIGIYNLGSIQLCLRSRF
jgi:thiol-disulfide isomerase/thioredoxin